MSIRLAGIDVYKRQDGDIRVVGHDHGQECSVNAKSLLGLLYSTTWNDIWCVSDNDIYSHISKFAAD